MHCMSCPSFHLRHLAGIAFLLTAAETFVGAAENDLRIVPQVMIGTSGFEPGVALEWRGSDASPLIIRPEVLLSEDGRPGAGLAILYNLGFVIDLPARQALAIGPRAVYHHADDTGWEGDALATWSYDLTDGIRPWRHALGALAALGVVDDRRHDEIRPAGTIGAFYSFRF